MGITPNTSWQTKIILDLLEKKQKKTHWLLSGRLSGQFFGRARVESDPVTSRVELEKSVGCPTVTSLTSGRFQNKRDIYFKLVLSENPFAAPPNYYVTGKLPVPSTNLGLLRTQDEESRDSAKIQNKVFE